VGQKSNHDFETLPNQNPIDAIEEKRSRNSIMFLGLSRITIRGPVTRRILGEEREKDFPYLRRNSGWGVGPETHGIGGWKGRGTSKAEPKVQPFDRN